MNIKSIREKLKIEDYILFRFIVYHLYVHNEEMW